MNLFVSFPHSGLKIPKEAYWLKELPFETLMCDPDLYVDELYENTLKKYQIPAFWFEWHRYAIDANRFVWDVSPQTVEKAEKSIQSNPSKKSPSDIHWQQTTLGTPLIKKAISQKRHQLLIKKYFDPFHKKIKSHIETLKKQGKKPIYLLDLHSMPSKASPFHKDQGQSRTEVVIGDNEGKSCSVFFRDLVLTAYQKAGFKTALNDPYSGGAITKTYGQAHEKQEAVQIELNRKLYMDEVTKEKNKSFSKVEKQLEQALSYILKKLS